MNNTELWEKVFATDPDSVKKITGKPYPGNSPKPYELIRKATEVWGPCGFGWGIKVKSEYFFKFSDEEIHHIALVQLWYMKEGKRCKVEQMGQTRAYYKKQAGGFVQDEDAAKKSVTDGTVKCLSMLGFAGDIFSGRWDDSKYIDQLMEEKKQKTESAKPQVDESQVIEELEQALKNCPDEAGLRAVWGQVPAKHKALLGPIKDKIKTQLGGKNEN